MVMVISSTLSTVITHFHHDGHQFGNYVQYIITTTAVSFRMQIFVLSISIEHPSFDLQYSTRCPLMTLLGERVVAATSCWSPSPLLPPSWVSVCGP